MKQHALPWLIALAVLLLAQGCASVHPYSYKPKENDGTLVFYRQGAFNAAGVGAVVGVDGQNIFNLGNNQYASVNVSPGTHRLGVQGSSTVQKNLTNAVVLENQKLFFKVEPNPARFAAALIAPLDLLGTPTFLLKPGTEGDFDSISNKLRKEIVRYVE